MSSMIYSPLAEYDSKLRALHAENADKFLNDLIKKSGVNIEENRKTVKLYEDAAASLKKLRRKFNWMRFWRVLMCISIILIPVVIWKITPKIKKMRCDIEEGDKNVADLLSQAQRQMAPLNNLFSEKDALDIIEKTIPNLSFAPCFSVEQENNMIINYDFNMATSDEQSTIDVLAGNYNENPFLFENKLIHEMGVEIYHGYKTITWTETYTDDDGRMRTRVRSQTLHASVAKPKPFYRTQVVLNYCAQGGPDLSFTRDATHLDQKSDRQIEKYVKRGEKKLKKMTDKAIKNNSDFVSMSNSDFEVLFDALDRTHEVQFRTLFTPLAQNNMVDLIRSQVGFGDDFHFIKQRRTNKIISKHSQGRQLNLSPKEYVSYSFDIIESNFLNKNAQFFKAVYFDFAPLWAIPMYQERPVHSLHPIPALQQKYSYKECEALVNGINPSYVVHPQTKTQAILKSSFVRSKNNIDEICVSAFSYDIMPRLDLIPVYGDDGYWHNVPVPWDEYIPLEESHDFFVATDDLVRNKSVLGQRNNLCIFE